MGCIRLADAKTANTLIQYLLIRKYKKRIVNKSAKERGNPPDMLILKVETEAKNKAAKVDETIEEVISWINLNRKTVEVTRIKNEIILLKAIGATKPDERKYKNLTPGFTKCSA